MGSVPQPEHQAVQRELQRVIAAVDQQERQTASLEQLPEQRARVAGKQGKHPLERCVGPDPSAVEQSWPDVRVDEVEHRYPEVLLPRKTNDTGCRCS